MEFAWYDIVGSMGVLLVLVAYLLLHMERMRVEYLSYSLMNGLGAILILVSLSQDFNFSAVAIETAWLGISIWGVILYFTRTKVRENSEEK